MELDLEGSHFRKKDPRLCKGTRGCSRGGGERQGKKTIERGRTGGSDETMNLTERKREDVVRGTASQKREQTKTARKRGQKVAPLTGRRGPDVDSVSFG